MKGGVLNKYYYVVVAVTERTVAEIASNEKPSKHGPVSASQHSTGWLWLAALLWGYCWWWDPPLHLTPSCIHPPVHHVSLPTYVVRFNEFPQRMTRDKMLTTEWKRPNSRCSLKHLNLSFQFYLNCYLSSLLHLLHLLVWPGPGLLILLLLLCCCVSSIYLWKCVKLSYFGASPRTILHYFRAHRLLFNLACSLFLVRTEDLIAMLRVETDSQWREQKRYGIL